MRTPTLLMSLVMGLSLVGAGCGASTDTTVTTPRAGQPSVNGSGSATVGAPSDIPQYPNSTVTLSGGTGALYILAMTTSDSASDVIAWYDSQFASAGFKAYGGIDLKASARQYGKGNVSMTLSVIDKSQPAAGGKTIVKVSRQEISQ